MDGSFDCFNDGNLDDSTLDVSLGSTDGFALGIDEGIKMVSSDCELLGIPLGDDDGITLGLNE